MEKYSLNKIELEIIIKSILFFIVISFITLFSISSLGFSINSLFNDVNNSDSVEEYHFNIDVKK